ncbi:MAG: phage portal protein [Mesorhizobium sp.]|uniref:phage portal protein n=1 Tax=Mesorhizobium sp. TaxID=1871066 RepID=UPI00122541D3|nr:phage portal protein [Mesorhizobium sp.]TIR24020.1 MAG: phage portal protein [Mesorhizobium sp.]
MGLFERFRRPAQRSTSPVPRPKAAYFNGEKNPFLFGWNPQLREHQQDVQASWEKAAARAISAVQNSGFIAGIVEVASGSTVGAGLRMACRPDGDELGWNAEYTTKWARKVEARFRAWARKPLHCDASGEYTFAQLQQAAFASYLVYGEVLPLFPMIQRPGVPSMSKVKLLPPTRIVNRTDPLANMVQGVKVDSWGLHLSYRLRERDPLQGWRETTVAARDADGRPNMMLIKDPAIATTRGISPFASILKVTRQVDQYFDANMTAAMIQTIFAATIRTNISGAAAYDGLLTRNDDNQFDAAGFANVKGEWYDEAKVDLSQHGRIAHLFPGDELDFTESKQGGQQFDNMMGWLLREISRGAGVTYESATGDYRGATYSSVRMAGAVEWLTVLRRRGNIVTPFCDTAAECWLDEEIATGRIEFPGGYQKFLEQKEFAAKFSWTGPARPQADDYKTAKAYETRKGMHSTTLQEIGEEYGRDWDDDMRQRAAENALADELKLPKPWAAVDLFEVKGGDDAALKEAENAGKPQPQQPAKPAGTAPEPDPAKALADEIEPKLEDEE